MSLIRSKAVHIFLSNRRNITDLISSDNVSVGNDLHVPDNASLRVLALDVTSNNVTGHDAPVGQVDASVPHDRLVATWMPLDPNVPRGNLQQHHEGTFQIWPVF